jgi:hypothetical protein
MQPSRRPAKLRFSVDHWAAFWANPHPDLAAHVVTPDVIGHWPGDAEPVRGVTEYKRRIARILTRVPDLRLTVAEHASNGEFLFIRWIARGTGGGRPFELSGVDRLRLRDGLVRENWVYYDPVRFESLVQGASPGDGPSLPDRGEEASPDGASGTWGARGGGGSGGRRAW